MSRGTGLDEARNGRGDLLLFAVAAN